MKTTKPSEFWQFAAVSEFLQLFIVAFGIDFIGSDELESGIMEGSQLIIDLHIRLLRKYFLNRKSYLETIWLRVCGKEITKRLPPSEYPFEYKEGMQYSDLTIKERVQLLHFLCEVQFDFKEFRERVDKFNVDQANWRVSPIGHDAAGNTYWMFDDCRLYRETPDSKSTSMNLDTAGKIDEFFVDVESGCSDITAGLKDVNPIESDELQSSSMTITNSPPSSEINQTGLKIKLKPIRPPAKSESWKLMCRTREEWEEFPKRFQDSTSSKERKFHKYLTRDLIPLILRDLDTFKDFIAERDRKFAAQEALKQQKELELLQYEAEVMEMKKEKEIAEKMAEQAKKKPKIDPVPKRTSSRVKERVMYSDLSVKSESSDPAENQLARSRRSTGAYNTRNFNNAVI